MQHTTSSNLFMSAWGLCLGCACTGYHHVTPVAVDAGRQVPAHANDASQRSTPSPAAGDRDGATPDSQTLDPCYNAECWVADAAGGDSGPDGDAALSCSVLPDGGTTADAGDVSYSWTGAKEACFGEPFCQAGCATAFLQGLLDCDAVEGGYFWNFGSVYIRVAGRRGGSCVYDIGSEIEGAVTYQECTAPMPVAPWPGLHNVNGNSQTSIFLGLDGCVSKGNCSVQSGLGTPCDEGPAAVPACPSSPGHC